jgi:NADPH:quinone reductase-like Zn-dependent oxidoreductase
MPARYGAPDVVRIVDVEMPIPRDNEVLIKVRAASVNPLQKLLLGRWGCNDFQSSAGSFPLEGVNLASAVLAS